MLRYLLFYQINSSCYSISNNLNIINKLEMGNTNNFNLDSHFFMFNNIFLQ